MLLGPWRTTLIGLLVGAGLAILLFPLVMMERGIGLVIGIFVFLVHIPLMWLVGAPGGEASMGRWTLIGLSLFPVYGALVGFLVGGRRNRLEMIGSAKLLLQQVRLYLVRRVAR